MGRLLAIGDIHGHLNALETLVELVSLKEDDTLVTLGDYVDRGPDSAGVIEWLIKKFDNGQLIPLLGNHDQMMLWARHSGSFSWEECGGDATLASYGVTEPEEPLKIVPQRHWDFLDNSCRKFYESTTHIFTHATPDAGIPICDQTDGTLLWQFWNEPLQHISGRIMVFGHTAQKSGWPLTIGHAVCIDTWVYGPTGWLTCLDVDSGEVWQARENGETRTGWLDEEPTGND